MKWLLLFYLAVLPVSAAETAAEPALPLPDYDLPMLRMELKDFDRAIESIYYFNDAYGTEVDSELVYNLHPGLWTDTRAVKLVQEEMGKATEPRMQHILHNLNKAVSDLWLWRKVSPIDDEELNAEAKATVVVDGKTLSYRDLDVLSYNEKDATKRKEYYYAGLGVVRDQLNPLYMHKIQQLSDDARALGYKNYSDYVEKIKGYNFAQWDKFCREILEKTKGMMRKLTLEELHAAYPGRSPATVMPWDREGISRHAEYDKYFPKEKLMSFHRQIMKGMGIDLSKYPNIWVDDVDRPTKGGRPATYVVVCPNDIRVNIKLYGGATDYTSVFHEMGHALHYANTIVPEYELQVYGDGGLTESYAFLMESLISDPVFLEEEIGMPAKEAKQFARYSLMGNLGGFRYYCRNFLYENYLHQDKPKPEDYYAAIVKKDAIYPVLPESITYSYLSTDEQFYGIYYLEAWFTEAVLADYLEKNFGRRWWKDARSGEFLIGLWHQGEEINSADLCKQLGEPEFGYKEVLQRMEDMEKATR
jgi:hypothetical protein